MSVSPHPRLFNYSQVNFDRVTTSPSQSKFSFCKAPRFPTLKVMNHQVGYKLPSTIVKKTATFGVGDKVPYQIKKDSISPETYRITSLFDRDNLV